MLLLKATNTYPIVTLSEGHIKIEKKYNGVEAAKELARTYADRIGFILKGKDDVRLRQTYEDIIRFYSTGLLRNDNSLI